MPGNPPDFLDTNILIYAAGSSSRKAAQAEALLRAGGTISVQVLNELANVGPGKMSLSWPEMDLLLATMTALMAVVPVTLETHANGLRLAQRYGLSIYDAMIVAAALLAGCTRLWSEDMHDGLVVEGTLTIRNPF